MVNFKLRPIYHHITSTQYSLDRKMDVSENGLDVMKRKTPAPIGLQPVIIPYKNPNVKHC
jgi:hypothetical protein